MHLIAPMFSGPIDVVGDVHGEIDALEALLRKLGYRADGRHPEGRRLVFVGDLIDRGPDSPAVLDKVMALVRAGHAQCILGNHELNLLRADAKHGNEWFMTPEATDGSGSGGEARQRPVPPERKAAYLEFLHGLPLALERTDLRVVHACWHRESIERHRTVSGHRVSAVELYRRFERVISERIAAGSLQQRWREEREKHGAWLRDRNWPDPVMLPAQAAIDEIYQMGNPVRVLTSGVEEPAPRPFWASGKWRMLTRGRWWEQYEDPVPVVVGHYWRRFSEAEAIMADKFGPDLFAGIEPHHWMGGRGNVYCVDFSVGARSVGRSSSATGSFAPPYVCQLAALRVPEWEVVHDDHDEVWALGQPG